MKRRIAGSYGSVAACLLVWAVAGPRQVNANTVIDLTTQVSTVEDIDLPKTITELTLQQTAYQAALAATAKVVQPSLVDFLR